MGELDPRASGGDRGATASASSPGSVGPTRLSERLPAIELRAVGRQYRTPAGEVWALRGISLVVGRGEAVAVTGPSGSGKTTLLNLVAGLDTPTEGEVLVLGESISGASDGKRTAFRARNLGLVFQDPHLLPGLSALDNLIVARLPFEHRRALEPRARELLDAVGLGERIEFPPARLSAGERQRVGLARALLARPALVLADEPTGNLDAPRTEELMELLSRLRVAKELTLVIATHDPSVASFADRVVRLVDGHLVDVQRLESGPPLDVHVLEP